MIRRVLVLCCAPPFFGSTNLAFSVPVPPQSLSDVELEDEGREGGLLFPPISGYQNRWQWKRRFAPLGFA